MKLNTEQIDFLKKYKITKSSIFNAEGLTRDEYRKEMKALDKIIAYGVSPCSKFGHTLRLRTGHCVMCSPKNLAYFKRYYSSGQVYIAGSLKLQLLKIGFTHDIINRQESLNRTKYADTDDWEILLYINDKLSGQLEFKLHGILKKYNYKTFYTKEKRKIECYETYKINYNTILKKTKYLLAKFNINKNNITECKTINFKYNTLVGYPQQNNNEITQDKFNNQIKSSTFKFYAPLNSNTNDSTTTKIHDTNSKYLDSKNNQLILNYYNKKEFDEINLILFKKIKLKEHHESDSFSFSNLFEKILTYILLLTFISILTFSILNKNLFLLVCFISFALLIYLYSKKMTSTYNLIMSKFREFENSLFKINITSTNFNKICKKQKCYVVLFVLLFEKKLTIVEAYEKLIDYYSKEDFFDSLNKIIYSKIDSFE